VEVDGKFYDQGLYFECQRCSRCCRYEPGFVFLSLRDLSDLEIALNRTRDDIMKEYCKIVDVGGSKRVSLKERDNFDCIFWADGVCTVYEKRPLQCRSFPFWNTLLQSTEDWEEMKKRCPGIGKGRRHEIAEIRDWLARREEEPVIVIPQ